jgi:hypothetical protein
VTLKSQFQRDRVIRSVRYGEVQALPREALPSDGARHDAACGLSTFPLVALLSIGESIPLATVSGASKPLIVA